MGRGQAFQVGRARATARIGLDYLRALLLPYSPGDRDRRAGSATVGDLLVRPGASRGPLPSPLRMVSWNIHRSYDARGVAAGVRSILRGVDPHVLLLQEVPVYPDGPWWMHDDVRGLVADDSLAFAPMHAVARPTPYFPFRSSGLLVAVRGDLEAPTVVPLPAVCRPKLGPNHRIGRVALGVRCRVGGVPTEIWNVHLENTARPSGRALQASVVADAVGRGPAIVGGDFNTLLTPFERVDDVLRERGLARVPSPARRGPLPQLDHLFVRGLRPLRAERLPIRGSDHLPIFGEFELNWTSSEF